jgi:hypothetical protein
MANALSLVQKMEGWENIARWVAKSLKNLEKSNETMQTTAQTAGYEQQVKKVLSAKITGVEIEGDLDSAAEIIKNFKVNDPYSTYLFDPGEIYDNEVPLGEDTMEWNGGITLEGKNYTSSVKVEWTAIIQGKIIGYGADDDYDEDYED